MTRSTLFILVFFLAGLNILCAQKMYEYTRDFKFNDGIYLTIEEFKNNKPSIPLSGIVEEGENQLGNTICMRSIEYIQEGAVVEISTGDVWGICMNGNPYIRHEKDAIPFKQCFLKLLSIGSITTFYMQRVQNKDSYWNYNPNPMLQYNASKVKVLQFALDVETGMVYDQKSEARQLIEMIKRDDHFKDQKIKKRDVGIFITLYNKRNPFYVPLE